VSSSFRLGSDGVYRCDALQAFVWQKHGFGTRKGNPEARVTVQQIHSARVCNAAGVRHAGVQADALVTDRIRESIGVRTADCVPILLLDVKTRAVGAIHAGWRGTAAEISANALRKMAEDFDSEAGNIYAVLGPCIRVCCYEVDAEVAMQLARFGAADAESARGKQKVDLAAANRFQLQAAGVSPERIFDCELCTRCLSEQFYSYRRQPGDPGRMISSIARLG